MLCRVEMPKNEQIYSRFYRYRLLRSGGAGQLALPAALFVICVFLFLGSASPFVPVALLVVVAIYLFYLLWLKPTLHFRALPGAALVTEVTILTDTGLTQTARSEEGGLPDNLSLTYSALLKAVETGRDFYLFTSPAKAILIDKEYFTKGTPGELRATLRQELGEKFKARVRDGQ